MTFDLLNYNFSGTNLKILENSFWGEFSKALKFCAKYYEKEREQLGKAAVHRLVDLI